MGFFLEVTPGAMSWRMASNTTLNWESYLLSRTSNFRAKSWWEASILRRSVNARMMAMFTWMAGSELRTEESMATPFSVKA